jgi:hypothetical protein
MNTALWTVFSLTGFGKVLCYKPALRNQRSLPPTREVDKEAFGAATAI